MTSFHTHQKTKEFFKSHSNFGLQKHPQFFQQGKLPIQMKKSLEKNRPLQIFAPDGNGSLYESLARSGLLSKMDIDKIEMLHVINVDNVMAKVCDPIFTYFSIGKDVCMKALKQNDFGSLSKMGSIVLDKKKNIPVVLEYFENSSTDLNDIFFVKNIGIYVLSVDFIKRINTTALEYHKAEKNILMEDGRMEKCVKREKFIFDAFNQTKSVFVFLAGENEYCAIKNGPNSKFDNSVIALERITKRNLDWILKNNANVRILRSNVKSGLVEEKNKMLCEISGRISYDGEGLDRYLEGVECVELPFVLGE